MSQALCGSGKACQQFWFQSLQRLGTESCFYCLLSQKFHILESWRKWLLGVKLFRHLAPKLLAVWQIRFHHYYAVPRLIILGSQIQPLVGVWRPMSENQSHTPPGLLFHSISFSLSIFGTWRIKIKCRGGKRLGRGEHSTTTLCQMWSF